jgi:ribonuclease P protein component
MRGESYLTRTEDFSRIYRQGKHVGSGLIGIKVCTNALPVARCGFVVSRRVGNAIVRNRVKRRLREIVRRLPLKTGMDIVFSARPRAAIAGFETLKLDIINNLSYAGLLVKDDKENCIGND